MLISLIGSQGLRNKETTGYRCCVHVAEKCWVRILDRLHLIATFESTNFCTTGFTGPCEYCVTSAPGTSHRVYALQARARKTQRQATWLALLDNSSPSIQSVNTNNSSQTGTSSKTLSACIVSCQLQPINRLALCNPTWRKQTSWDRLRESMRLGRRLFALTFTGPLVNAKRAAEVEVWKNIFIVDFHHTRRESIQMNGAIRRHSE